jgi:hypothetical protein
MKVIGLQVVRIIRKTRINEKQEEIKMALMEAR